MLAPIQGLASLIANGLQIFSGSVDPTAAVPAVAATGLITLPATGGAAIIEGETFTIKDGTHTVVFEFDSDASVGSGNIPVEYVGKTRRELELSIEAAINGVTTGLTVTAAATNAGTVTLTNDAAGTAGNQTQSETVVDAGFVLSDMTGGAAISGLNPAVPALYFKSDGTTWVKTGATGADWTSL